MKLLVDGAVFQLAEAGIARVWRSLLSRLVKAPDLEIILLDRGGSPKAPGIVRLPFPAYTATSTAADSLLIEQIASDYGAEVFTSTYYTTPVGIPSVLLVHDRTPKVPGFDKSSRIWQEQDIAIAFARRFVCVTANTRADLLKLYPKISGERAIVAHCGVEHDVFRPFAPGQVESFVREYGLDRPYFVLMGSREPAQGGKNAAILFEAIKKMENCGFDVLCVGGEPEIQREYLVGLPEGVRVKRVNLDGEALACAYAGARALVIPSPYEGSAMPVIEAMACGCPVITTRLGSLGDVAADAAEFVSGRDSGELAIALAQVCEPARRSQLVERGFARAKEFNWDEMARALVGELKTAAADRTSLSSQRFFEEWTRLRTIQAAVDTSY